MQGAIPYVPDELRGPAATSPRPASTRSACRSSTARARACNWRPSRDGVAPGTFPPDEVPTLFRDDYVHNGNDSHWLTNPEAPLTGFDRIIGIENAERSYRTRLGPDPGRGAARRHRRPPRQEVQPQAAASRSRSATASTSASSGATTSSRFCDAAPGGFLLGSSGPVDVGGACDPLRNWNLHDNLDSSGAILFRRFATNLLGNFHVRARPASQGATAPGSEHDLHDPVLERRPGPHAARPQHRQPAGRPGARRRGHRPAGRRHPARRRRCATTSTRRAAARRSRSTAAPATSASSTRSTSAWDPDAGYPDVHHGSSFIMAAEFTRRQLPRAGGHLRHLRPEREPALAARDDYTRAFSQKKWNHVPFCGKDVRKATISKQRLAIPASRQTPLSPRLPLVPGNVPRMRVGLVLGAGGVMGGAWLTGALHALAAADRLGPGDRRPDRRHLGGVDDRRAARRRLPPWFMVAHSAGETFEGLDRRRRAGPPREADRAGRRGVPPRTARCRRSAPALAARARARLRAPHRHPPAARARRLAAARVISTEPLQDTSAASCPSGWADHPGLWVVACDYATGRRVAFGRDGAPPRRARRRGRRLVRDPRLLPPGRDRRPPLRRRRHVLDLEPRHPARRGARPRDLPEPDLVAAPDRAPGTRAERLARTDARRSPAGGSGSEAKRCAQRGTEVVLIQPTADDLEAMGPNLMSRRNRNPVIQTASPHRRRASSTRTVDRDLLADAARPATRTRCAAPTAPPRPGPRT